MIYTIWFMLMFVGAGLWESLQAGETFFVLGYVIIALLWLSLLRKVVNAN